MFELIFVLIFVATLLVTGITFMTVLAATGGCITRYVSTRYDRCRV